MNISRVYTPVSGSKLFVAGDGVAIATTSFESHVICHEGPTLVVGPASRRWREAICEVLTDLTALVGGACSDEHGVLRYFAPSKAAAVAAALTVAVATRDVGGPSDVVSKCLLQASLWSGSLRTMGEAWGALQAVVAEATTADYDETVRLAVAREARATTAAFEWEEQVSSSRARKRAELEALRASLLDPPAGDGNWNDPYQG